MRLTACHLSTLCGLIFATSTIYSGSALAEVWQLQLNGKRLVPNQANKADQAVQEVLATEELNYDTQGKFIWTTHTRWPGGIEFRYQQTATTAGSDTIDLLKWRDGLDINHKNATQTRNDFADLAFYHPKLLLANLSDLQELKSASTSSTRHWQFKDAAGRPASYISSVDGKSILSASNANFSYHYSPAVNADAPQLSQQLQVRRGTQIAAEWQISLQPVAALAEQQFTLPAEYQSKAERGPLRVTQLADGVFRIDGTASAYHTGFVVGSESIAVFDAPISPEQAQLVKAAIQAQAPGIPIRHLIVSHAHRDHIAGIPAYADDALKIYSGRNGSVAIRRQLGEDLARAVHEIQQDSEIDLGQRTLRLLPFASAHAEEMLVAYDVKSHTLFQGDLFYLPELGPVPKAFPVGFELQQLLQSKALNVNLIVGVHGRSASYAEFLQGLKLAQP